MHELLSNVLAAYGGTDRWRRLKQLSYSVRVGGRLWDLKQIKAPTSPLLVTCQFHLQQTEVAPFESSDWVMTFTPDRVVIESRAGETIVERSEPGAAFAGHVLNTPWDPLHLAFFYGYTAWTEVAAPWLFSEPDFETWEIEPMSENGEIWRSLRVRFPDRLVTHHKEQTFRIGPDGLIRRHDYDVDVWAGLRAAQYLFNHVDIQGLKFPGSRRVYLRREDNTADTDFMAVSAEMSGWTID